MKKLRLRLECVRKIGLLHLCRPFEKEVRAPYE